MEADFAVRNKNRPSEAKAIQYLVNRDIPYIRYGLDVLDSDLPIYKISSLIRSAPDYIIFNQYGSPLFFEVKGFRDCIKIKLHDVENYEKWNNHMGMIIFLYDVEHDAYCEVMFNEVKRIIMEREPDIDSYPESPKNLFYRIPTHWLPDFTNF